MNALGRLLGQSAHFRRPPVLDARAALHKEWLHFCVLGPGVEAIINFSVMGDTGPGAIPGAEIARVVLLVRAAGTWDGEVATIPMRDVRLQAGRVDAVFGNSTVRFEDGGFVIDAAIAEKGLRAELRLVPLTMPLFRPNTPLVDGPMHWLVAPRLAASGTITAGGTDYVVRDAPAYHDHNWGKWLWGHDFAWQWGFGLPEKIDSPWSFVLVRIIDRGRNRDLGEDLFVWRGDRQHRIFREQEIRISPTGYLRREQVARFPRAVGLIAPESTDVPREVEIVAEAGGDSLVCHFQSEDVAQLLIPNETDLGLTIINEVSGRVSLAGNIRGETVRMNGRGFFEFLTTD